MLSVVSSGHGDLSDVLLLIAVVGFVVAALLRLSERAASAFLVAAGLAFFAAALLVQ